MRSTLRVNIELTHSRNLHTDAQGIADELESFLTNRLAQYDDRGSSRVRVWSAAIQGQRAVTVEAVSNA